MKKVKVLILTGFGLNCDYETVYSFKLAGASAYKFHINSLINKKIKLENFHIIVFGGGFSWGDYHGAGIVQALKFKNHIKDDLLSFATKKKLIIGICNGFQVLINLGLLPALDNNYTNRCAAITFNDCGNFVDRWVHLSANIKSPCIFTKDIKIADYPIRHGEGKFIANEKTIKALSDNNQIVFKYANEKGSPANGTFPLNPNGSIKDIAGICDPTGRIFGLMPHPEAYNHFTNHPDWTRTYQINKTKSHNETKSITPGIKLFKNGVDYIKDAF